MPPCSSAPTSRAAAAAANRYFPAALPLPQQPLLQESIPAAIPAGTADGARGASSAVIGTVAAGGLLSGAAAWRRSAGRRHRRRAGGRHGALAVLRLRATALEEAPQKIAEEAINAAVRAVDVDEPGQEEELDGEGCRVSYVSRQRLDADGAGVCDEVDDEGLPLVYSVSKLNKYWGRFPGELTGRWGDFLGLSTPWIARVFGSAVQGRLAEDESSLANEAVDALQTLGPTFIKLGQVLSIRPDILSPVVMEQLGRLQDNIQTFDTQVARGIIEEELGKRIEEVFSDFSEEPVAAASLAQVYKAKLKESGVEVAVKVQRPAALATVSKDLYVMRKAAGVVTELTQRFTQQTTDFKALVETFGEGLYTELDFRNEALNQIRMKELINTTEGCGGVVVPEVHMGATTRRVLVTTWVDGTKLSQIEPERIKTGIADAQNVFLHQLLTWGFFHGDPHPGNLLLVNSGPDEGKLVLLDFGLVAQIPPTDREYIITAVIHLGTKNWDGLIDDFIKLRFLPQDCDRAVVIPVMQRVLSPYLKGGGAAAMNFYALGQDLLQATLEIPFSIPPYVSLLARSVATLEGIALAGDPGYRLVGEAYPFVVRKLLEAPNGSARLIASLRELLLDSDGRVRPVRLSALLQAAVGVAASADDQEGFIDFDAVPKDGAGSEELVEFLVSPAGRNLKPVVARELATTLDLVVRTTTRRAYQEFEIAMKPRVPIFGALPTPPAPPVPVPTPTGPKLLSPEQLLNKLQPKLDRDEEIYFQSSAQVFLGLLGVQVDPNKGIDTEISPRRVVEVLGALASQRDDQVQQVVSQLLRQQRGRGLVTEWWGDMAKELREITSKRVAAL